MDHSHDLAALKRLSVTQLQARHAELFGEITTARHRTWLIRRLAWRHEDVDVRRGAALGLGTFGAEAQDAIPALQAALHDRESSVRKAAGIALWYIDQSRFPDPRLGRNGKETRQMPHRE